MKESKESFRVTDKAKFYIHYRHDKDVDVQDILVQAKRLFASLTIYRAYSDNTVNLYYTGNTDKTLLRLPVL